MTRRIPVTICAMALGLTAAWAGPSQHPPVDGPPRQSSGAPAAPTPEELAGATYTDIEDLGPVTLHAGKWEGAPLSDGDASRPRLRLSEGFRLAGDLDGDGANEAVAYLIYSSGGTGNFGYLAVMARKDGEIVQRAIGPVGDRVQIREARIEGTSIVLGVLQAGPDDGLCCPTRLATRRFAVQNGRLIETASEVTGTASLSMLEGRHWVLRKLDGNEAGAAAGESTLVFASGTLSGSTGCNRYQGPVGDRDAATGLVVGSLVTTRMACPEPVMVQEQAFLERLSQAETFQFLVGDLVLSGPKGTLTFSPRGD